MDDGAALTGELFDAIAAGDVERVKRAIAAGVSPDAGRSFMVHERFETYEVHETALVAALRFKQQQAAITLLALGASPHPAGGDCPLDLAIAADLDVAAGAILDAGAEATVGGLCLACARGAELLALRMLDAGLDVNATLAGASPLSQAAWGGHLALVHALIARGASVTLQGVQALFKAANAGRAEVVAALLTSGVPVDVPDAHGWTALMTAAWQDQPEVARILLRAGANRDHRDASGKSVLDWARQSRQRSVVALLEQWRTE